jgi:hypothetical protein
MNDYVVKSAEDYLAFHELDLQNSFDLTGTKVIEATIPSDAVRKTRMTLGLSLEMMAVLLGVNLSTMVRYETISLPPYPQGNISRKLGLLINWLADPNSCQEILGLIAKDNGLATLSGLLQTESVVTFISLAALREAVNRKGSDGGFNGPGKAVGNA